MYFKRKYTYYNLCKYTASLRSEKKNNFDKTDSEKVWLNTPVTWKNNNYLHLLYGLYPGHLSS